MLLGDQGGGVLLGLSWLAILFAFEPEPVRLARSRA
jgi:hypothetical protein